METFHKHNNTKYDDTLIKEADSLNILRNALEETQNKYIKIPELISVDNDELIIEMIDIASSTKELSMNFGVGLALLHRYYDEDYGLDSNNYIGLAKQENIKTKNWGDFFVNYRLRYQVNLIKDDVVKQRFINTLDAHATSLEDFLNNSCKKPSLVHGDLWSGNVLYGTNHIYLIDPAVYYADREVDIAMTRMFSGFDDEFYKFYDKTYPLSKEYNEKEIIYNLYHYLNHYNLFGSAYLNSCINGFSFIKSLK